MRKLLTSLLFILPVVITRAQNIDTIVEHAAGSFMKNGARMGLSIGVISKGKTYQYHFGTTHKGLTGKPNDQTIYEIGSITKTFTSLLLAQAVEEKKVNLNADIRKYLKGNYDNLQYQGKPIRLIHLANLTSGLPNNLPEKLPAFKTKDLDSQLFEFKKIHDTYTREMFLADLHQVKLTTEPGLKGVHSNTAAELMGFLLENIYGESYPALLKKYITGPLQMSGTFVSIPVSLQPITAIGYNDKGVVMPDVPEDAGSAGAIKSSLADMIKYMTYQLKEKDSKVRLSHQTTWGDEQSNAVGLNWWTKTNFDGKRKIWTSGGTFGFASYGVLYPERDFAFIALSNESDNGTQDALDQIGKAIYNELYFGATERSSEGFGYSAALNALLIKLNQNGFEQAIPVAKELLKSDPKLKYSEGEINSFGYRLLGKGQRDKALEIFKLNVELFPKSSNTYDSLAETYESTGNKALAIKYYTIAIELDPSNTNSAEHLKKLKN